jgi:acyl-CoA oxidase
VLDSLVPSLLPHRERLAKLLEKQPWGDKSNRYFLTRNEEYTESLKAAVGIW